ncbi:MAG: type 1 glutamine amidotransferase domain-containing protein [Cyclobacteriaceae bacterium]
MSTLKKITKWFLLSLLSLIIILAVFGFWFRSLLPPLPSNEISKTLPTDLPYLIDDLPTARGKILAVVTSTNVMGSSGKSTGYELTELSRAYFVFQANGFEVDIASPQGGNPPVIIDDEDMGPFDFAFLNDKTAQRKAKNTWAISDVNPDEYAAIYFVGGKGAMYDFPENEDIQAIVSSYYQSGKVIGAVCHGPAALVNVTLDNGQSLLKNKRISSFTNQEELFLIPDAATIFPFLLEDKLVERGAKFSEGTMYLENVMKDGNLVTGQNPWSTWTLAESMIQQLGYTPKERLKTPDENAIEILGTLHDEGYSASKKAITAMGENDLEMNRILLAMHGIVAAMQWELGKSFQLIGLLSHAKSVAELPS